MTDVGLTWAELDTPALWIDLDKTERNIAKLGAHFKAAGVNWRPHTKGIKVPAIAHKLIRAGAIGVTCAKVSEAEVMAAAGIPDILIANEVVTPTKITRLVNLAGWTQVKVCVDNAANVDALSAAAHARGVTLGVLVEINTGMQRSGVLPGEPTVALAKRVHASPGLRLAGLMTWEGHNLGFDNPVEKKRGIEASIAQFLETGVLCRAAGLSIEIMSAGGSGTYQVTPFIQGVTEIEAGGGIFCDLTYQGWGMDLEPSIFVKATVTSRPAPNRVILDCGFKTLPRGYASAQLMGVEGVASLVHSAEHGIVTLDRDNTSLAVGDGLDLMVGYSDATVFLHDTLFGLRRGVVEAAWPVLGRGKIQ